MRTMHAHGDTSTTPPTRSRTAAAAYTSSKVGTLTGETTFALDVHLPLFTHWLHGAEFKRPKDVAELSNIDGLSDERLWEEYLFQVLESAAHCDTEQKLNKNLAWALLGSQSTN